MIRKLHAATEALDRPVRIGRNHKRFLQSSGYSTTWPVENHVGGCGHAHRVKAKRVCIFLYPLLSMLHSKHCSKQTGNKLGARPKGNSHSKYQNVGRHFVVLYTAVLGRSHLLLGPGHLCT